MAGTKAASRPKTGRGAAARSEMNGDKRTIVFEGVEIEVPKTIKFGMLRHARAITTPGEAWDYCEVLLGAEQMEKLTDIEMSTEGGAVGVYSYLTRLIMMVEEATGLTLGESEASSTSSGTSGTR